uniref:Uncharacterized protein n=1 Tax=Sphaerodactylus townsendi TaxID=933632 RepID=A0ACB8EIS1_9SAUR
MTKGTFMDLVKTWQGRLQCQDATMCHAIPVEKRVAITSLSYYHLVQHQFGTGVSTVVKNLNRRLRRMERLQQKFPSNNNEQDNTPSLTITHNQELGPGTRNCTLGTVLQSFGATPHSP